MPHGVGHEEVSVSTSAESAFEPDNLRVSLSDPSVPGGETDGDVTLAQAQREDRRAGVVPVDDEARADEQADELHDGQRRQGGRVLTDQPGRTNACD